MFLLLLIKFHQDTITNCKEHNLISVDILIRHVKCDNPLLGWNQIWALKTTEYNSKSSPQPKSQIHLVFIDLLKFTSPNRINILRKFARKTSRVLTHSPYFISIMYGITIEIDKIPISSDFSSCSVKFICPTPVCIILDLFLRAGKSFKLA